MRKLTALAFVTPVFLFVGSLQASSITLGGNTYELTNTAESWTAAEAEAVADGGHLASIHSAADNQALVTAFFGTTTPEPLWIGIYDPVTGDGGGTTHLNDFVWSDGSTVDFTDWNIGEPNNAGGTEYYGVLGWHNIFNNSDPNVWNDAPVNGTSGYGAADGPYFGIIEIPGDDTTAPEPASFLLLGTGAAAAFWLKRRRTA